METGIEHKFSNNEFLARFRKGRIFWWVDIYCDGNLVATGIGLTHNSALRDARYGTGTYFLERFKQPKEFEVSG